MPAVGNLNRFWQGPRDGTAIASVAVAGDDLNPRTGPQPGLDRGRFPVWQEVNNPAPLQISDQGAVSLPLPPSPIFNAYKAEITA